MKKLIFLSLALVSVKGFSQDADKSFLQNIVSRLSFGIKAGGNYSNYTNAGFATDPLYGFHAGATVSFKINQHFRIIEDILYSQEGAKNKSDLFGGNDIKLSYLSVPVLLRYKTTPGFFIEAGGQASVRLNEHVDGLPSNSHFAGMTNFGVVGGIGFQLNRGLGVSARYIYGVTKAGDLEGTSINNNFNSSTAQLSLFYNF